MKAPRCKTCGKVEYGHLCRTVGALFLPARASATVPNRPKPASTSASTGDVARVRRWRQANPERHRDYMRGYMARRRQGGG